MEKKLVALLLSAFIPGLGQLYNGQLCKGILIQIALWFSMFMCFALIGFLMVPAVWLVAIWDAMVNAHEGQA